MVDGGEVICMTGGGKGVGCGGKQLKEIGKGWEETERKGGDRYEYARLGGLMCFGLRLVLGKKT